MINPPHFEAIMHSILGTSFVGMNNSTLRDTRTNETGRLAFGSEDGGDRAPTALPNDDNYLVLSILIAGISAAAAILFLVCWFYIATKIATIYLSNFAFPAYSAPFISSAIASRSLCSGTREDL
jgi:hypothetical protein